MNSRNQPSILGGWLLALLAALVAVLATAFGASPAAAASTCIAETRVGASVVSVVLFVGPPQRETAVQRHGKDVAGPGIVVATGVAAKSVPEGGVVYSRTDLLGGKPYVGQAKSEARYSSRQAEHARANPDADFDFEIVGRANPGTELDRMEEFFIRRGGGPTNLVVCLSFG